MTGRLNNEWNIELTNVVSVSGATTSSTQSVPGATADRAGGTGGEGGGQQDQEWTRRCAHKVHKHKQTTHFVQNAKLLIVLTLNVVGFSYHNDGKHHQLSQQNHQAILVDKSALGENIIYKVSAKSETYTVVS